MKTKILGVTAWILLIAFSFADEPILKTRNDIHNVQVYDDETSYIKPSRIMQIHKCEKAVF